MTTVEQDGFIMVPLGSETPAKKRRRSDGVKPCERCRSQHLKCIYPPESTRCQRCERTGNECIKSTKKIQFRDVPASKFRKTTENQAIRINDQFFNGDKESGPRTNLELDTERAAPTTNKHGLKKGQFDGQDANSSTQSLDSPAQQSSNLSNLRENDQPTNKSPSNGTETRPEPPIYDPVARSPNGTIPISVSENSTGLFRVSSIDQQSVVSFASSSQPNNNTRTTTIFLDDMVKVPHIDVKIDDHSYLETILLRYFHEELAPWFDICDPFHHFTDILPQKARQAGPLRSALLTISARNLSHNQMFRSPTGTVQWKGHLLPNLSEEFAISHHNECIRELLKLSLNHQKLYDETLLAAVVVLRTDEEMLHEVEDKQLFLRIASLFIDAQLPPYLAQPHTSPQILHSIADGESVSSPSSQADPEVRTSGLRHACLWTALRQDLHAAFLKQQSVKFPLLRCEAFRQLAPATDAEWANRMVVLCADVLEFCYGSESIDAKVYPAYTNHERWQQLRSHERALCASLPSSFEPTYCREPNSNQNETFPSLFYLDSIHVSGTTYVELARLLLGVFDPARPKLGPGCLKATEAFVASTKKILFRLCGIALSNSDVCPPSLVNASLGIALFGEYVEDPMERNALLGVLSLMVRRYNYYPTAQISTSLRQAWSIDDNEMMSAPSVGYIDIE